MKKLMAWTMLAALAAVMLGGAQPTVAQEFPSPIPFGCTDVIAIDEGSGEFVGTGAAEGYEVQFVDVLGEEGVGGSGSQLIIGSSEGPDDIDGGSGNDYICTSFGADVIHGGSGNDIIYPNQQNDTVNGDSGNDVIFGRFGNDTLHGNSGRDTLLGGAGGPGDNFDTCDGGNGFDEIDCESIVD